MQLQQRSDQNDVNVKKLPFCGDFDFGHYSRRALVCFPLARFPSFFADFRIFSLSLPVTFRAFEPWERRKTLSRTLLVQGLIPCLDKVLIQGFAAGNKRVVGFETGMLPMFRTHSTAVAFPGGFMLEYLIG